MRYIQSLRTLKPDDTMTRKFREMIAKAAAEANAQITEVNRGEYRPRVEVVMQGERTSTTPARARAAA